MIRHLLSYSATESQCESRSHPYCFANTVFTSIFQQPQVCHVRGAAQMLTQDSCVSGGMLWRPLVPRLGSAAAGTPEDPGQGQGKAVREHGGSGFTLRQDKHSKTQEALRMPDKSTAASVGRCYQRELNKEKSPQLAQQEAMLLLWKRLQNPTSTR